MEVGESHGKYDLKVLQEVHNSLEPTCDFLDNKKSKPFQVTMQNCTKSYRYFLNLWPNFHWAQD